MLNSEETTLSWLHSISATGTNGGRPVSDTIVEPTSGNTGVGLAMQASAREYCLYSSMASYVVGVSCAGGQGSRRAHHLVEGSWFPLQ